MKGDLLWLVLWAGRAGTRYFCSTLAALVVPVQNICFLTIHYSFGPIALQTGQAAMFSRLSLSKCFWSPLTHLPPFGNFLYWPLTSSMVTLFLCLDVQKKFLSHFFSIHGAKQRDFVHQLCFCCAQPWLKMIYYNIPKEIKVDQLYTIISS
jgi:hypothetical protein